MNRPELLAPGGSFDALRGAINAGADAVYMGGTRFGARAYAQNPDDDMLLRAIDLCHLHGKKLYLTVNTLLREEELEDELCAFLAPLYEAGLDAVLVQDLGVLRTIRTCFPALPIHASTQMSVQSVEGALLAREMGISRIVPARELSLEEIRQLIDGTGLEVECFIHGALCYCYSGQCLASSLIGGRSGNRGRCAQTCRLPASVIGQGKGRSGAHMGQGKGRGGAHESHPKSAYWLSLKDICTLSILPSLIEAGIASFKIEGRMKRPAYAAGVTAIYRRYIDLYLEKGMEGYKVDERDMTALMDLFNRGGFSSGYYTGQKGPSMLAADRPNHSGTTAGEVTGSMTGKAAGKVTGGAGGKAGGYILRAARDLYKGDVLQSAGLSSSQQQDVRNSFTLGRDVPAGRNCVLPAAMRVRPGEKISRISSPKLLEDITERYLTKDQKVKIKGNFILTENAPAILEVSAQGVVCRVSGPVPESARGNAMTQESVRKQLLRTGDTPFVFTELAVELQEGLFVPVSALNRMRREALDGLQAAVCDGYRRKMTEDGASGKADLAVRGPAAEVMDGAGLSGQPRVHVLVSAREQLPAAAECAAVDRIYVDSVFYLDHPDETDIAEDVALVRAAGKECMLAMPWTWRQKTELAFSRLFTPAVTDLFDGFLLRLQDQIPFGRRLCRKEHQILAADSSIYSWNTQARRELSALGITSFTLSQEQSGRELAAICDRTCELMVYGYQKVMISEQCLQKNTAGCTHKPTLLWMRSRTGRKMPVMTHCGICMNTFYNSEPLYLCDVIGGERLFAALGAIRYDLTTEDTGTARQILAGTYVPSSYTRGHFFRGAE